MVAPDVDLTAPPIRLLTIEHAGAVWRYSSRPCEVLDGSTWRHYRGGLAETDVYLEAPLVKSAQAPSLPVELMPAADLSALVQERHLLSEMRAEVSLWVEGTTYGQRRRLIEGPVTVDSGGYDGRPLRLTVTADDPVSRRVTWPPPSQVINDDTWSTSAPNRGHAAPEAGAVYQQVFGQAGAIRVSGAPADVPAVPVHPVTFNAGGTWPADGLLRYTPWGDITTWTAGAPPQGIFGLVSSGWMYPGSGSNKGQIRITKDTGAVPPVWKTAWMYYATDGLGQVVTLARLQDGVSDWGQILTGGSYYAAIPDPCSGIARRDWRGGLEGAGEIARWALETSGRRVDWRRTGAAIDYLDLFRLGGFWDQSVDPWEWYQSNIAQILPATWVPGPDGLYPVVWRLDATAEQADLRLIDGPAPGANCCIEGEPREEGHREILTRISLDYGNGIMQGQWRRGLTYHGRPERERVLSVPTPHARRAQQRWGSQVGDQVQALELALQSDFVYRDETAHRWLSWLSTLRSQPMRVIRVVAPHTSPLARAEPGMVAAITSARYSLSNRVSHVTRAGWLGGMCYADLVILPRP